MSDLALAAVLAGTILIALSIELVSFFAPIAVVAFVTYYALDWSRRQAEIGGLAEGHRDLTAPVAPAPADRLAERGCEGDEQAAVVVESGEEVPDHALDLPAARA